MPQRFIFNHEFAKALWGEEIVHVQPDLSIPGVYESPLWKQRLMDMVVAEDPIKYLGENL
jgi:hypothetical protein